MSDSKNIDEMSSEEYEQYLLELGAKTGDVDVKIPDPELARAFDSEVTAPIPEGTKPAAAVTEPEPETVSEPPALPVEPEPEPEPELPKPAAPDEVMQLRMENQQLRQQMVQEYLESKRRYEQGMQPHQQTPQDDEAALADKYLDEYMQRRGFTNYLEQNSAYLQHQEQQRQAFQQTQQSGTQMAQQHKGFAELWTNDQTGTSPIGRAMLQHGLPLRPESLPTAYKIAVYERSHAKQGEALALDKDKLEAEKRAAAVESGGKRVSSPSVDNASVEELMSLTRNMDADETEKFLRKHAPGLF